MGIANELRLKHLNRDKAGSNPWNVFRRPSGDYLAQRATWSLCGGYYETFKTFDSFMEKYG